MFWLDRLPYRTLQWLVAAFAVLHDLEEALTIPRYAPAVRQRLSHVLPPTVLAATQNPSWVYAALAVATVIPILVVLVATTRRSSRGAAWAVGFMQSLLLANVVVPHIPAAVAVGGYVPGLTTAVAINLPYSVYFLGRSVRDGALSRGQVLLAVALAVPALVAGLGTLYLVVGSPA